jgi:hypothetical protein
MLAYSDGQSRTYFEPAEVIRNQVSDRSVGTNKGSRLAEDTYLFLHPGHCTSTIPFS